MVGSSAGVPHEPWTPVEAWRRVRGLRATPLGHAVLSKPRRRVFSAALEQAEELAEAARASGAHSKPLLQFYAVEQAGRAIAACLSPSPDWNFRLHGMKFEPGATLAASRVVPKQAGAFPVVAAATDSPALQGPATLSELWASLPELHAAPLVEDARRCLPFRPSLAGPLGGSMLERLQHGFTAAEFLESDERLHELLPHYPSAIGFTIEHKITVEGRSAGRWVTWPNEAAVGGRRHLEEVGVRWGGTTHYVRPALGGEGAMPPSLLMTWWAVMLIMSSLARYHPGQWRAALDPDHSPTATDLEALLDIADWRLPQLIEDALVGTTRRRTMRDAMRRTKEGGLPEPPLIS